MDGAAIAQKTVFILGITSDIGKALAQRYLRDGYAVVGTYRNLEGLQYLSSQASVDLLHCDVAEVDSVRSAIREYSRLSRTWDVFISCVGTLEPIGGFFDSDFEAWERSVILNSTAQLRVLHALYPYRRQDQVSHAVYFAGGGTNNPFTNYSAYCVSKILLIKMCELLDDETNDLNVFIVGTGWVRTKLHIQTVNNAPRAGQNYQRTVEFMESNNPGTSYDDIYNCINWCVKQGRAIIGGRNFSVVHDPWRQGGETLARQLLGDFNKFKLRRFKNTELEPDGQN
jgi:NAD(P)-dependent dehydrogenase (short-subunit alcohol dehydrogenase family)